MADQKNYLLQFLATLQGDRVVTSGLKRIGSEINKTKGEATSFGTNMKRVLDMAGRAVMVAPIWATIRGVMNGVNQVFGESIKFLIEWEYQLAQIRIVGGMTETQIQSLSKSILNLGANLGISYKELGEGTKLWSQQGKSFEEIIPLMESTAKLSLLTGRSMTESVEDLTAVMQAYGMTAQQTGNIIDTVENVELQHAITTDNLVSAYRRTASMASQMGISFEKLTGIITATHVVTRSAGGAIGNAWKTIFARMATTGAEALATIAQIAPYINEIGQPTMSQTKTLRSFSDVLTELGLKWDSYSKSEKLAIAEGLAGKRQINEFMALMLNFKESVSATADAFFSAGKAQRAIGIITETTKNKIEQLSMSWVRLIDTIANTGAMKSGLNLLSENINNLAYVLDPVSAKSNMFQDAMSKSNSSIDAQVQNILGLIKAEKELSNIQDIINKNPALSEKEPEILQAYKKAMTEGGIKVPEELNTVNDMIGWIAKNSENANIKIAELLSQKKRNELSVELERAKLELEELGKKAGLNKGKWQFGFTSEQVSAQLDAFGIPVEQANKMLELYDKIKKKQDELAPTKEEQLGQAQKLISDINKAYTQEAGSSNKYKELVDEQKLLANMKMEGASELQIEIQKLALLEKRKVGEEEIFKSKKKIADLTAQMYMQEKGQIESLYVQYYKADEFQKSNIRTQIELMVMSMKDFQNAVSSNAYVFDQAIGVISSLDKDKQQLLYSSLQQGLGLPTLAQPKVNIPEVSPAQQLENAMGTTVNNNASFGDININLPEGSLDDFVSKSVAEFEKKVTTDRDMQAKLKKSLNIE